jgi:hypothetical protein
LELESAFPIAVGNATSIRELPDGSVLLADPMAPALLRMDFDAGTLDTLGREGDGPEEYRQPDNVFALAGDSTLMVDLGRLRFTVVAPDGSFAGGTSMSSTDARGAPTVMHPHAVDAFGGVYYWGNRTGDDAVPDSVAVVRFDRETMLHDTMAMVWLPELPSSGQGGGRRPARYMLRPADDWVVRADGALALIRANGYSVEWVHTDGTRVSGPVHPVQQYPVGQPEKEAEMESFAENAFVTMVTTGGDGGSTVSMRRGLPSGGGGPSVDDFLWSEVLPIFGSGYSLVSPRGEVWVQRRALVGETSVVDIFDDTGVHVAEVSVPPSRKVVGLGSAGDIAYLVRRDEVGLRWVERYRIVTDES